MFLDKILEPLLSLFKVLKDLKLVMWYKSYSNLIYYYFEDPWVPSKGLQKGEILAIDAASKNRINPIKIINSSLFLENSFLGS